MSNSHTIKKIFSRETEVSKVIKAPMEKVWKILTNATEFSSWNSTIESLSGEIKEGGRIELVSVLSPKRTFKLEVKEFHEPKRLVWGDSMGRRVFELSEVGENTKFTMNEKIGGLMFPLFAKMIPDFDESFNQFVEDLEKVCEAESNC